MRQRAEVSIIQLIDHVICDKCGVVVEESR